jgi:hypothetical protein
MHDQHGTKRDAEADEDRGREGRRANLTKNSWSSWRMCAARAANARVVLVLLEKALGRLVDGFLNT